MTRTLVMLRNYTGLTLALAGPGLGAAIVVPPRLPGTKAHDTQVDPEIDMPIVAAPAEFTAAHCFLLTGFRDAALREEVWSVLVARSQSDGGLIYAALAADAGRFYNTRVIEPWPVPQGMLAAQLMLAVNQRAERDASDLHVTANAVEHENGDSGSGGGCGGDGP